jgi:hypothetical protein
MEKVATGSVRGIVEGTANIGVQVLVGGVSCRVRVGVDIIVVVVICGGEAGENSRRGHMGARKGRRFCHFESRAPEHFGAVFVKS